MTFVKYENYYAAEPFMGDNIMPNNSAAGPETAPGAARWEKARQQWESAHKKSELVSAYRNIAYEFADLALESLRESYKLHATDWNRSADLWRASGDLDHQAKIAFNKAAEAGRGRFTLRFAAAGNAIVSIAQRVSAKFHLS